MSHNTSDHEHDHDHEYEYDHEYTVPQVPEDQLDEIRQRFEQKVASASAPTTTTTTTTTNNEINSILKETNNLKGLRIHSIKKEYSLTVLTQFYNELMVPNFPLENELDDLDDWIYCLDPEQIARYDDQARRGPIMDVLILLCDVDLDVDVDVVVDDPDINIDADADADSNDRGPIILGGVALEYYQDAEVGLISYVVVNNIFQRNGIMKTIHPLAIKALHTLHDNNSCSCSYLKSQQQQQHKYPIRAIFAETNTVTAGDASVKDIRQRHVCLYKLGYRMLEFPYVQPPLEIDSETFDDVMLLVYQEDKQEQEQEQGMMNHLSTTQKEEIIIPSIIPYSFIVDFFNSVFGYNHNIHRHHQSSNSNSNQNETNNKTNHITTTIGDNDITNHWYYKFATWFTNTYPICNVKQTLPWDDVMDGYHAKYNHFINKEENDDCNNKDDNDNDNRKEPTQEETQKQIHLSDGTNSDNNKSRNVKEIMHVVIIGAGAAGLSATVELAKKAALATTTTTTTTPLHITLIEANDFVGGRIRTIVTTDDDEQHQQQQQQQQYQYVTSKKLIEDCKVFHPWPVPIGAEFIHGVNSVVNDTIIEKDNDNDNDNDELLSSIKVEETFDLCPIDEYPNENNFVKRHLTKRLSQETKQRQSLVKVFGDGQCFDLKRPFSELLKEEEEGTEIEMEMEIEIEIESRRRYARLISKANSIWDELYLRGEDILQYPTKQPLPQDKSLSIFVKEQMQGEDEKDIETVKSIIDAVYAKTAGTSVNTFGVNEGAREEVSWDYSESNWRSEGCFAEIVTYYLDVIKDINLQFEKGMSQTRIEVITSTPVTAIESIGDSSSPDVIIKTKCQRTIRCNKVIVAVPLSILKAEKIKFDGIFSLPQQKCKAIESINMFSGMKAHLLLCKDVDIDSSTNPILEDTELFFCPDEIFVQVWLRRNSSSVFVTGFVVADDRDRLLDRIAKGETAEDIFLNQIQRMSQNESSSRSEQKDLFRQTIPTCSGFMLHDWSDDEFIMGMYSSPSVDAGLRSDDKENGVTMRHDLRSSIHNTIFFAGEHTNIKTCATVQAAIESGVIAAGEVIASKSETKHGDMN